jgi:hypothetical protein
MRDELTLTFPSPLLAQEFEQEITNNLWGDPYRIGEKIVVDVSPRRLSLIINHLKTIGKNVLVILDSMGDKTTIEI